MTTTVGITETTIAKHACSCGGAFDLVDKSRHSATVLCAKCGRGTLIVDHPDFKVTIRLADFHLKRGDRHDQRATWDFDMAYTLVHCVRSDVWPSPGATLDFGIESHAHYGAIQHAVRAGVGAYELDRVIGDGPAITELMRCVPGQPFFDAVFETPYDGFARLLQEQYLF